MISIRRVAWGRVTTPDYAAHTHTRIHTQCRLPQIASLSFLGERQGCQITGCHLHKLSSFLNVNVYKQLGQEKEKERGMGVIGEEKDGGHRIKEREKRVAIV